MLRPLGSQDERKPAIHGGVLVVVVHQLVELFDIGQDVACRDGEILARTLHHHLLHGRSHVVAKCPIGVDDLDRTTTLAEFPGRAGDVDRVETAALPQPLDQHIDQRAPLDFEIDALRAPEWVETGSALGQHRGFRITTRQNSKRQRMRLHVIILIGGNLLRTARRPRAHASPKLYRKLVPGVSF